VKIRTRLFLVFMALVLAGIAVLVAWIQDEMRPRYMEAQEELLVDFSQLLAAIISTSGVRLVDGDPQISPGFLRAGFTELATRNIEAQVYSLKKQSVDIRIYVTDARGTVLLDTDGDRDLGGDYSSWRDVSLTLRGEYGARSTTGDPLFEEGATMYVAAPILYRDAIIGAVSVGKPTRNAERFLAHLIEELSLAGVLVAAAATLVGLVLYWWLARPLQQLLSYAKGVSDGSRVALPPLGNNEVGRVGEAMEEMRIALDGKAYVSDYVQALTHELKSPIAAIRGAAELLEEEMPVADRARFLANIRTEVARMQGLIVRLLDLAAIESRPSLEHAQPVDINRLVREAVDGLHPVAERAGVKVRTNVGKHLRVDGDSFLLSKAVSNLLKNAVEFSAAGDVVRIEARQDDAEVVLTVKDQGAGIPQYAQDRVFDRFYALPKADGSKGSGLGLSFVKEIAALLQARLKLDSAAGSGTCVELRLPVSR